MQTTYLNLASYSYRRAKYHANNGNVERANECLKNARAYDTFACEVES